MQMRLRHLNFCAALLATVRAKISRALSSPWRFEGAYHFLAHEELFTKNCLSAKKYHFFVVDIVRLLFFLYPKK